MVEVARRIRQHRTVIDAAPDEGLSNALVESTNTKIRLITRVAFGFKAPHALIALAMLSLGGYQPDLPDDPRIGTENRKLGVDHGPPAGGGLSEPEGAGAPGRARLDRRLPAV